MSNLTDHLEASRARLALSEPWDGARSRRVFDGALRSRVARARRHRFVAIACTASAAVFVLAAHSFGAHAAAHSFEGSDRSARSSLGSPDSFGNASNNSVSAGAPGSAMHGALVGQDAISMNADLFADGGSEAD